MRSLLILLSFTLLAVSSAQSQSSAKKSVTKTFKVYGQCGMCKSKIEKTLSYTSSVKYGEWDVDSKMLTVKYNPSKTNLDKIKQALADVGYDTQSHRSTDATYNKLHGCCKYERPD